MIDGTLDVDAHSDVAATGDSYPQTLVDTFRVAGRGANTGKRPFFAVTRQQPKPASQREYPRGYVRVGHANCPLTSRI